MTSSLSSSPMLSVRLMQGSIFKYIFAAFKDLVNEISFDWEPTDSKRMTLQGMCSSHISLVRVSIEQDAFSEYRCDRAYSTGVNIDSLNKILKTCGPDDTMEIKSKIDKADNIDFMFKHPQRSKQANFSLKLMDIDAEYLDVRPEFSCVITMPPDLLECIIKQINVFGASLRITANSKEVVFETLDGDMASAKHIIQAGTPQTEDDPDTCKIKCEEDTESSIVLATSYIVKFIKATDLKCPTVKIKINHETYFALEYAVDRLYNVFFFMAGKEPVVDV